MVAVVVRPSVKRMVAFGGDVDACADVADAAGYDGGDLTRRMRMTMVMLHRVMVVVMVMLRMAARVLMLVSTRTRVALMLACVRVRDGASEDCAGYA